MSLFPLYMIFKSLAASNRGELTALARRAPLVFYCKKRFHKVAACTQGDFQRQTMFFLNSGLSGIHQSWLDLQWICGAASVEAMVDSLSNEDTAIFNVWPSKEFPEAHILILIHSSLRTLAPESGGKLGDRGESFCSSISAKSAPCHNSLHRESIKKGKVFSSERQSHRVKAGESQLCQTLEPPGI